MSDGIIQLINAGMFFIMSTTHHPQAPKQPEVPVAEKPAIVQQVETGQNIVPASAPVAASAVSAETK